MSNTSRTDWSRIDAMTDKDIDMSDIPPLTEAFFENTTLRMPKRSLQTVAFQVNDDTLAWFQSQGQDAEQHMSAALQIYAEAQKRAIEAAQSA